ncbi:hypothetical protein [Nocardioides sp.]|uniref:hypothetical protein n=1 Tax=Nocardioides sp. TaxID=35761 RepID=UPI0039E2D9D2
MDPAAAPLRLRIDPVTAAVALVVVQLAIRAWALSGSWLFFDDFAFISRVQNDGIGWQALTTSYGGHLMPAGLLATWANVQVDPLGFPLYAVEMMGCLALADLGAVVFLVSAFGRRWGILPPLVIYLFTVLTVPAGIWWAAGVNQLPFLAALFWGGWTHLRYLRTRRLRWALATMAITLVALAFQEKSLYGYLLFAVLALGYFATGDILARIRQVAATYRAGVVLYGAVAVAYLGLYLWRGQDFKATPTDDQPLWSVAGNMSGQAYATGILGGPLTWNKGANGAIAQPGPLVTVLAVLLLLALVYHLHQVRRRSLRALLLVIVPLAADIVLVTSGRTAVGPFLALEYRYLTELAAFSAIALGLATLPLRGAVETVEAVRPSAFLDLPGRVTVATCLVGVLGTSSVISYATHWHTIDAQRAYVTGVADTLEHPKEPIPLVDNGVPLFVMWAFGYPENTLSHIFKWLSPNALYPRARLDDLYTFTDQGKLAPMVVEAVRTGVPRVRDACPFPARKGTVEMPLDGPVVGTGWWARVGYYAEQSAPVTVVAGDETHEITLEPGLHSLFFTAGADRFEALSIEGLPADSSLCVSEVVVGSPTPLASP